MRERRLRTQIHKHSRDAVSATVLGDGPAFDVLRMAASIAFDLVRAKKYMRRDRHDSRRYGRLISGPVAQVQWVVKLDLFESTSIGLRMCSCAQ
jgi:hypothetical protein